MATIEEVVDVASPTEKAALESLVRRLILLASEYGQAVRSPELDAQLEAVRSKGKKLGITAGAIEELIAEFRSSPAVELEIFSSDGLSDNLPPDEQ